MSALSLRDATEGWNNHQHNCPVCAGVDCSRPRTLAGCCHAGAQLVKDYLSECALHGGRDPEEFPLTEPPEFLRKQAS